jgi:hypothetical protein
MLPPKIREIVEGIERNRRTTLEMVSGLSEEEFAFREQEEWSIALILEHLVLAETGTSKVIRKVLKEGAGRLPPYPADDSALVVRPPEVPREKMSKAPEAAQPKGGRSRDEILAAAKEAREQTLRSLEMMAGADPRAATFPHPLFGDIDLFHWAWFILLEHERIHHGQIAGILEKLGRGATLVRPRGKAKTLVP